MTDGDVVTYCCRSSCSNGQQCREEVLCTAETCPYGQKGWRHAANCIKHICAHDFRSGPCVSMHNGHTASCACGITAFSHAMMYAP